MGRKPKSVLVDDMTRCMICGTPYPQVHHVFFGTANRKLSDTYHYVVPLCQSHHTGDTGAHFDRHLDLFLKQTAQKHFEANIGSRDAFREIFGKSWL